MGTVTIRNLDDKIIERLKIRAKNHRRSLEAELPRPAQPCRAAAPDHRCLAEADRIAAMTPKGVKQTDSVILLREDRSR